MVGFVSIVLAAYQAFATTTGRRPISHARGAARVAIAAWFIVLGSHLAYEWVSDDIGQAAAEAMWA